MPYRVYKAGILLKVVLMRLATSMYLDFCGLRNYTGDVCMA